MDRWTSGQVCRWAGGQIDRLSGGQVSRWTGRPVGRWAGAGEQISMHVTNVVSIPCMETISHDLFWENLEMLHTACCLLPVQVGLWGERGDIHRGGCSQSDRSSLVPRWQKSQTVFPDRLTNSPRHGNYSLEFHE